MASRLLRLILCLSIVLLVVPAMVKAATVGRFVQVEGHVDLLKGGKLPVAPAKVQQAVDQGDVVRTKSGSRAQIQFVDETVLTIGPSSRVAIEDYVFDADKGERSAAIEVFRGLVQTVVKKIYQMEEPDFVVKTHTSVLGVRGTKWYTQIQPTTTDVYTEEAGTVTKLNPKPSPTAGLEVKNRFPEIKGKVILKAMQFTRVGMDLPPTLPVNITQEDLKYLKSWMNLESGTSSPSSKTETGTTSSSADSQAPPTGGLSTVPATTYSAQGTGLVSPTYLPNTSNLDSPVQYYASGFYVPPQPGSAPLPSPGPIPPSPPTPQPQTYYFTQSWLGTFVFQSEHPFTQGTVDGWGWGERTGVLDGHYSAKYSHTRFPPSGGSFGQNFVPGTSTGTMEGSVTGFSGQTLTGTMDFTGELNVGGTFNYSGDVSLEPSGSMVYNYSGTHTNSEGGDGGTSQSGVMHLQPGTYFRQTVSGATIREGSFPPYYLANVRNDGVMSGTQLEGPNPGSFQASFQNNVWGRGLNQYPVEPEFRTVDISMEGVLSGSPDDVMTGAMTTTASGSGITTSVVGGPVMAYPNGTLAAELYGSRLLSPGRYEREQGIWVQTSDPEAITFTSTFGGSIDPFESSPPYNTGTTTGRGFGYGEATVLGGGWYTGTVSGEATGPNGNFEPPTSPREIFYNIAGVAKQNTEGTLQGQVFATGLSGNDVWLYSDPNNPGTVTVEPEYTSTITLQNQWKGATGSGPIFGTFTATISPMPGTYFQQVAGPGSLTYTSVPPYTQQISQLTDEAPITNGTGSLGNFIVSNLSGTTTVNNGATGVFPAMVVRPNSTIYSRGVIGPEGMGAMDLTVVDSAGWYRVRGAVIQTSGANLQGLNLVDNAYGPNRVPIQRVVEYQQGLE